MFEQIYKTTFLKSNPRFAFLMGFAFAIIGIFSARIIFGSNPGLMSVAFTAILLIPSLNNLLSINEQSETREKQFSLRVLFNDHKDVFKIYTLAFFGIFLAYLLFSIVWAQSFSLFYLGPQLEVAGITAPAAQNGLIGNAFNSYSFSTFLGILANNFIVLIACLFLSFFYGAGSILFITWNASVWGSVFGYRIRDSVAHSSTTWFPALYTTILPVLPHMLTEAVSYFSAAIVGGVVSKAFLSEKFGSKRFKRVMDDAFIFFILAVILVIIAAFLEVFVFPYLYTMLL